MDEFRKYYKEHNKLPPASYVSPSGCKLGSWIADMKAKGYCRKERNILE